LEIMNKLVPRMTKHVMNLSNMLMKPRFCTATKEKSVRLSDQQLDPVEKELLFKMEYENYEDVAKVPSQPPDVTD
jgi:hypothetical protein